MEKPTLEHAAQQIADATSTDLASRSSGTLSEAT
jgi:hypothetical protein